MTTTPNARKAADDAIHSSWRRSSSLRPPQAQRQGDGGGDQAGGDER